MSGEGWRTARLAGIPPTSELIGVSQEDYLAGMRERAPHILGVRPGEAYSPPIWAADWRGSRG